MTGAASESDVAGSGDTGGGTSDTAGGTSDTAGGSGTPRASAACGCGTDPMGRGSD